MTSTRHCQGGKGEGVEEAMSSAKTGLTESVVALVYSASSILANTANKYQGVPSQCMISLTDRTGTDGVRGTQDQRQCSERRLRRHCPSSVEVVARGSPPK